jgi:hypothetical protein
MTSIGPKWCNRGPRPFPTDVCCHGVHRVDPLALNPKARIQKVGSIYKSSTVDCGE